MSHEGKREAPNLIIIDLDLLQIRFARRFHCRLSFLQFLEQPQIGIIRFEIRKCIPEN